MSLAALRRRVENMHRREWAPFLSGECLNSVARAGGAVFYGYLALLGSVVASVVVAAPAPWPPPVRLLVGMLILHLGGGVFFYRRRRMKEVFGRCLGFTRRESHHLDVTSADRLRASLSRIAVRRERAAARGS